MIQRIELHPPSLHPHPPQFVAAKSLMLNPPNFSYTVSYGTEENVLQFLKNNMGIEIDQDDADRRMSFYEIDHENPRLASMIMRTVVPVQIIEYRSPKYMNMLTGKEKVVFPKTERNVMSLSKMYVNGTREEIIKRMQELPSMQ